MNESQATQYPIHTAKIEQILQEIGEIKADMRDMKAEFQDDRKEFWKILNRLRESIVGNSKEGMVVRIDRNTQFCRNLSKSAVQRMGAVYTIVWRSYCDVDKVGNRYIQ